jgi:hypothetical protein
MAPALSNAHFLAEPQQILALGAFGLIGLVTLAWLVLFVAALISIIGSPHTGGMKLAWLVFAFVAPFLGSLLWFVVGRGDSYRRHAAS